MSAVQPSRGEIWSVDLDPTRGHEQAGERPALVISTDTFNWGPADLVVIIPLTTTDRGIPLHVRVQPSKQNGLERPSVILCDQLRSVSKQRFVKVLGKLSSPVMAQVEERLRALLQL